MATAPVSGDTPVLLPGPGMVGLVRAARGLVDAGLGRFTVVGGIAVTARLGRVHRATADVDAVVDTSAPPEPIRALLALPDALADPGSDHRVYVAGTKVEIQSIYPISDDDLDGLAGKQLLYVAAHRWALLSATPLTLIATDTPDVTATVPVATPAALIAMKLHAIQDRSAGNERKRAGDAWDIYQLLVANPTGAIAVAYANAAPQLRAAVIEAASRILDRDVTSTRRWLTQGDELMRAITADDVRAVGRPLIEALTADQP